MKRSLSIILALCMLIGMLPAVFAADGEGSDTVTFNFCTNAYADDEYMAVTDMTAVTEYSGSRNWKYLACSETSVGQFHRGAAGAGLTTYFGTTASAFSGWAAYKLKGLTSGIYTVSLNDTYIYKNGTSQATIYLIPASVFANTTDYVTDIETAISDKTYAINPEVVSLEAATAVSGQSVTFAEGYTLDTAGEDEYVLVFYSGRKLFCQNEIAFAKTADLPATISIAPDAASVEAGSSIELTVTTANAEGKTVTVTSASPSVATVSYNAASGKATVKGIAKGTATITAKLDGTEVSDTASVTVTNKKESYLFNSTVWKDENGANPANGGSITNLGGYTLTDASSAYTYFARLNSNQFMYEEYMSTYVANSNLNDYTEGVYDNCMLFEITVEEDGLYVPSMTYMEWSYGGQTDVYVVDPEYASDRSWTRSNITNTANIEDLITDSANNSESKAYKVLSFDTNKSESDWNAKTATEAIPLKKGGNWLFIVLSEGAQASNHKSNRTYLDVKSFELEKTGALPEEAPSVDATATLAIDANQAGADVSIEGYADDIVTFKRGTDVTVKAKELTGYTFRHWVRGTADKGVAVWPEAEYTFSLNTNTYLTAVYTEEKSGKLVEFYNQNGEYLSEAVAVGDYVTLPAKPSLTGYIFDKWVTAGEIVFTESTALTAELTRVVARFKDDTDTTFLVKTPDDATGTYYTYGTEIELTSDRAVTWLRNEIPVAYGKSYTYYVWDNATITTSVTGSKKPMVVLDADTKGTASMIEYYSGGKEIVEVGILYGDGEVKPTVESCYYKATSIKKGTGIASGQFTAKPADDEYTVARGYLIYNDNGTNRVIYSD